MKNDRNCMKYVAVAFRAPTFRGNVHLKIKIKAQQITSRPDITKR
jgi:hypothetical protein